MTSSPSTDTVMPDDYHDRDSSQGEALLSKSERVEAVALSRARRQSSLSLWIRFGMLHLFFFALYGTVLFALRKKSLVYSPAEGAVRYMKVRYNATLVIESPYNGADHHEVDRAWHELLKNMNIAVPKSDLERIGTHSIPIPDMDEMYFAGLSVFHELHCLKRLKQYTWREHYFPNITADEERLNRLHTDHCLEILRQAVLCHADVSLFTLQWSEGSRQPRADFSQEHQCADFDAINAWAAERRVDASKPGILTHPLFGKLPPLCVCNEIHKLLPSRTFLGSDARKKLWSLFQAQVTPCCRAQPLSASEVADVLHIARTRRCPFAVLGGGTSPFRGGSNVQGGITVDLQLMKAIGLLDYGQEGEQAIRVDGGAIWADVYRELDPRNLSAVGTRNSLTGVVGSILGGGISFFSQRQGWICDNVLEFEVVLANGSTVRASEKSHSDLFWALRGGGANFGVVTKVVLRIFPQPKSVYTFQRWEMAHLKAVFERLDGLTRDMGPEIQMISTNLGWSTRVNDFVISERMVASEMPRLPKTLPVGDPPDGFDVPVMEEYVYTRTTLRMAQVMDVVNEYGYFNFFGSTTIKSNAALSLRIAGIFQEEAKSILDAPGIQVYIVYNPVTVTTLEKMSRRGGNTLGLKPTDGPLTIVNINLHWSNDLDTPRMRTFMHRMITRIEEAAQGMQQHHPYIFLSHCFEDQKPLPSVFQTLQSGYHKLGMDGNDRDTGAKIEL
ncbi:protein of unknown function (DUF3328) domain containing protein [Rhypophila sp. PSN 637]